jgi:uncharacterized membrane protein
MEISFTQVLIWIVLAAVIAAFSGSLPFLLINLVVFVFWSAANTLGPKGFQFDLYPFQFLTMAVSLEAIFLSIFVLVSQNRQSAKDRLNADLDYQVNVKAEMEMSVMTSQLREMEHKLHLIHCDVLAMKAEKDLLPAPTESTTAMTPPILAVP